MCVCVCVCSRSFKHVSLNKNMSLLFNEVYVYKCAFVNRILYSNDHNIFTYLFTLGGARGVMVIVVGNGHGDTSSNPGRD